MTRTQELKKQLLEIKKNDWTLPEEINIYKFALELIDNIGDLDGELRDYLILTMISKIIRNDLITREQIKEILKILLSDKHLFLNVGEKEGDDVFNRSFSALVIRIILTYHRKSGYELLSEEDVHKTHKDIMKYMRLEQETRGYVKEDGRGWAHAIAHGSDVLASLANCVALTKDELKEILEVIREKVCITDIYTHGEDERLSTSVIYVLNREMLDEEEVIKWIKSFENIEEPNKNPEKMFLNQNIKNFLRTLYFRLKYINAPKMFYDEIETVLNNKNELFNNIVDKDFY